MTYKYPDQIELGMFTAHANAEFAGKDYSDNLVDYNIHNLFPVITPLRSQSDSSDRRIRLSYALEHDLLFKGYRLDDMNDTNTACDIVSVGVSGRIGLAGPMTPRTSFQHMRDMFGKDQGQWRSKWHAMSTRRNNHTYMFNAAIVPLSLKVTKKHITSDLPTARKQVKDGFKSRSWAWKNGFSGSINTYEVVPASRMMKESSFGLYIHNVRNINDSSVMDSFMVVPHFSQLHVIGTKNTYLWNDVDLLTHKHALKTAIEIRDGFDFKSLDGSKLTLNDNALDKIRRRTQEMFKCRDESLLLKHYNDLLQYHWTETPAAKGWTSLVDRTVAQWIEV